MSQYFMESLRGKVTQGGADAFAETEVKTPVGRANNLAMAIHGVEWEHDELDTIAAGDAIYLQLTLNTQSAILNINSSEVIGKFGKNLDLVTSGAIVHETVVQRQYQPPQLYAKSSIYLGIDTEGQAGAKSGYARILYTLRYVSAIRMVQALTE